MTWPKKVWKESAGPLLHVGCQCRQSATTRSAPPYEEPGMDGSSLVKELVLGAGAELAALHEQPPDEQEAEQLMHGPFRGHPFEGFGAGVWLLAEEVHDEVLCQLGLFHLDALRPHFRYVFREAVSGVEHGGQDTALANVLMPEGLSQVRIGGEFGRDSLQSGQFNAEG